MFADIGDRLNARASVQGLELGEPTDSMAWVRASIIAPAAMWEGSLARSAESTMASLANSESSARTALIISFLSVTMELMVTSLPVPAVVGTVMSGGPGFVAFPRP